MKFVLVRLSRYLVHKMYKVDLNVNSRSFNFDNSVGTS